MKQIVGAVVLSILALSSPLAAQSCQPSETVACFLDSRIQVEVSFKDFADNPFTLPGGSLEGQGKVAGHQVSDDTALFWFDDPETPVVLVKVIDASFFNGTVWIFAAATTNQEVEIVATDTQSGVTRTYFNPLSTPFAPIFDTNAFDSPPPKAGEEGHAVRPSRIVEPQLNSCDPGVLCLHDSRFIVTADWKDFQGDSGGGQAVEFSNTTGLFWFFNQNNLELLVNIIDARGDNGHYWFYAAGLTNVEFTITVQDTLTGLTRSYQNPLGANPITVLDNHAFPVFTIEKSTNGINGDEAPGAYIEIGHPVQWNYEVKNHTLDRIHSLAVIDDPEGAVTCPLDVLEGGESMVCTMHGVAEAGQYSNLATVSGVFASGATYSPSDSSHYFGFLRDPEADIAYIPAAASVAGSNNTLWKTSLQLFNLGIEEEEILVALLEREEDNSEPSMRMITVPANRSLRVDDALKTLFDFEGAAALRLDLSSDEILVNSRTFNQGDAGTYGQFIPSLMAEEAVVFGEEARLIQLSSAADSSEGYRSNLGFVNTTDEQCRVKAVLFDAETGESMRTLNRELAPAEHYQFNNIFANLGEITDAFAVVSTSSEGGAFLCYASVVDNRTGDPVFILPAIPAEELFIAASARADGANNTVWRSDLELHEPSGDTDLQCQIALHERDSSNHDPETTEITVPAGRAVRVEDVLDEIFGFDGAAALSLSCDNPAMVSSRTYNQGVEGSYGQFISALPTADAMTSSELALLIQLGGSEDSNTGFRTNIGLNNGTDEDVIVTLELYRANGVYLGILNYRLSAFEFKQINNVFHILNAGTVEDGFALLYSNSGPDARFFSYASVVDNITGDPTYVLPEIR